MARKSNAPSLFDLDDAPLAVAEDPAVVARRETYRTRLAEKLKDPEFRNIEGFPIGTDEAILALSAPPYYTACPNPFLDEWLAENAKPYDAATDDYHREPFASDVSEGKNDPIYNAHSYHTKVPHKAIMRYILHYTQAGDVVYDGFCGTGMTGVAAQLCGDRNQIESLGYKIDASGQVWEPEVLAARQALDKGQRNPHPRFPDPAPFSQAGTRMALLGDLSPAATFIAYNYNTRVPEGTFESEAQRVMAEVEDECGWMYTTLHGCKEPEALAWANRLKSCQTVEQAREAIGEIPVGNLGRVQFAIHSEVFGCPECGHGFTYWEVAVDSVAGEVRDELQCPGCDAVFTKRQAQRRPVVQFDQHLQKTISQSEFRSVLVNYRCGRKSHRKVPDQFDGELEAFIARLASDSGIPRQALPTGDKTAEAIRLGVTHVHHLFTGRNARTVAAVLRCSLGSPVRLHLWGAIRDCFSYATKMIKLNVHRLLNGGGQFMGSVAGTYYLPSLQAEQSTLVSIAAKFAKVSRNYTGYPADVTYAIATAPAATPVAADTIDYIFTDPPFGSNLMYSELNAVWDAWAKIGTNVIPEAIENKTQGKGTAEYTELMLAACKAYFNALKPGRWMTVEFHNSATSVWNAIQRALELAGFVIADVRVLDKQQFSFKQINSAGATDKDLVISCYKPSSVFQRRFALNIGKPDGVREFVEQHLAMLPVTPVNKAGELERLAERTTSILYDRMIAYHLVRGAQVPMSASEFTRLLHEHFVLRDDTWFVPGQEVRYDLCKLRGIEVEQQVLFVSDERSAVSWLRSEVGDKPHTLGELTPKFMQATKEWPAHEPRPELRELLRDWFIEIDGRWANPNPDDEKHVEALRKKSLLRLFATYAAGKGKLKEFRREALIEAFRYCWNSGQEAVFVTVCQRIPDKLLRDDAQLSEAYDLAADRVASRPPPPQQEFAWE